MRVCGGGGGEVVADDVKHGGEKVGGGAMVAAVAAAPAPAATTANRIRWRDNLKRQQGLPYLVVDLLLFGSKNVPIAIIQRLNTK